MAATGFMKKTPLWVQILVGLSIGILLGFFMPELSKNLGSIGTAFMKAIKMLVIPLVFSAVTLGIYKMGADMKAVGKLSLMAFTWFYVATGIAIVIGIGLNELLHPAAGLTLQATGAIPKDIAKAVDWNKFFLDLIPENVVDSMAKQKIIPVLFFAVCFGISLAKIGEQGKVVASVLEGVMNTMFKMTEGIIATAPVAVAAMIAWILSTQGIAVLFGMAKLIGTLYIGLIFMAIVFCIILKLMGLRPLFIIKKIAEPLLLAFTTASSEVTLPVLMKILNEELNVPNKIASFVIPLGYSFNLDGSALYQALATCFLAEAYGVHLTLPALLTVLVTALIANKGTANVPSASLVVLAVLLTSIGLPVEAIAIIAGVDYFGSMGRTTINVFGNTVCALVLNKWGNKDNATTEVSA